tara:strand:- start:67 stop:207 length:141 start_codon:yes stop_codon:yes gene_type:complete
MGCGNNKDIGSEQQRSYLVPLMQLSNGGIKFNVKDKNLRDLVKEYK